MFNRKTDDPLDTLVDDAEAILKGRAALLEKVGRAEAELREAEAQVGTARGRVAVEEFEAAQKEGGLAVASKGAQQALAEAELRAKSARLRLQGFQAGLPPVQDRLAAAWAAVENYRQEFERGKILGLVEEFDQHLEAYVRLVCKARALSGLRLTYTSGQPFHPMAGLNGTCVVNPFTREPYVNGDSVRLGDRMVSSGKHWVDDPEAVALNQAIRAVQDRVKALGRAIQGTGEEEIEPGAESREDASEEPGENRQAD